MRPPLAHSARRGGLTEDVVCDVIALYHASKYPGAEFYVECAQLNVIGGSGDEDPESTVQFPGAYKASDPGEQSFYIHRRRGREEEEADVGVACA